MYNEDFTASCPLCSAFSSRANCLNGFSPKGLFKTVPTKNIYKTADEYDACKVIHHNNLTETWWLTLRVGEAIAIGN